MKAVLSNLVTSFESILLRARSQDEVWSILMVFNFLARADVTSKHAFYLEVLSLLREAHLWYTKGLISKEAYCIFVHLQQQCSSLLSLTIPLDKVTCALCA